MTYDHTGKQKAVVPLPAAAAAAAEIKTKTLWAPLVQIATASSIHLCYMPLLACNAQGQYTFPKRLSNLSHSSDSASAEIGVKTL